MTETPAVLQKTPLHEWHVAHGAEMVDFGGWEMPVQYSTGIVKEHLATRMFGGIFDVSHMGRFRLKGQDRLPFMQHVLTNNCLALEPWQSQYTMIQNPDGGALDDAFLYRFGEEDYLLVVNAANKDKDWRYLQEKAGGYKELSLEDHTASLALLAFQGPLTKGVLERLMEKGNLPEPRQNSLAEIKMCGANILLARTGYTGEPNSFELFVPAERAVDVWEALYQAGNGLGIVPVGLGGRDTLRLEASLPLYGHELGLDAGGREIPIFAVPQATLAVSFSPLKGDFIGRAALAGQFAALAAIRRGAVKPPPALPRRIMSVALLDRGIARPGCEVFLAGEKVGEITSGTSVPYWKLSGEGARMRPGRESALRSLALAYLNANLKPETELEIVVRKKNLKAQVVKFHGRSDAPPYFHALPAGESGPQPGEEMVQAKQNIIALTRKSIANHHWRQRECINLIPSEQTPSPLVRLLSISDPVCRYAEHQEMDATFGQEVYYYQGTDFIAWVEARLREEMARYLGCELVEVRPLSGQMANMTVFSAMVAWKNRTNPRAEPARISLVLNNHIGRGGHLSAQPMGALRDYIAKDPVSERFAVVNFPVLPENPFRIDLKETEKLLQRVDPELVVFGKSMVLHKEPVAEVKRMLKDKKTQPILLYDMAHVLGLVGPHFQMPFAEGANIVTGSTHKTFFGTQRGVVGCSFAPNTPGYELWEAIRRRAFPGMVSNHHLGTLLGLLAAAMEMNAFKDDYQRQILSNAKALARALKDQGISVCGDESLGFTETHQVLVDVGYAKGADVARRLEDNNIILNYQALPTDEGFTTSSGLRIGVAEMTRFGMKEKEMQAVAGLMAEVIKYGRAVKAEVARLRGGFVDLGYCFQNDEIKALREELWSTF